MDGFGEIKEKVEEVKTKVDEITTKAKTKVKKSKVKEKITKKLPRFEGKYYIWENGKKTHIVFIQNAIKRGNSLPVGFYKAAEKSTDRGVKTLLRVATLRKIPANVEKLDVRQ